MIFLFIEKEENQRQYIMQWMPFLLWFRKNVKDRTDVKQARKVAVLVMHKVLTYLEIEQDHPRTVQGCEKISGGWGANMAFQPVFFLHDDIPVLPDGQKLIEWINDM